ncbi:hypothetical protein ACRRM7_005079, partial [Escherichia coli]
MRHPTREYQRDSPSDLLLRRPQGIKPKKKIVKIRDSGLTRKVISASTEHRIDAYLLVSTTFHGRSSSFWAISSTHSDEYKMPGYYPFPDTK